MKVIAAPGPVSYPIIAATMDIKDIDIEFSKEGMADVVLDSTVSLVKRNLNIDYVTIKGLSRVYPKIGYKIGMTRKGGAADVIFRAYIDISGKTVEIKYYNDMSSMMDALNSREIDTVVAPAMMSGGETLESYLGSVGVYVPGSCGAAVFNNSDDFIKAYNHGIDLIKNDPEKTADYILSKLPMKFPREFIIETMRNSELNVHKPDDYKKFSEIVRKYSE
ncbi:DUF3834 domain-containing protein [Picrophilus oshimae]|uniref:DUF3834 domain-containing protein n=1 Tax=Picrophilus torridus (strain ATCC 700027 / DSM 9790 / JCM 10055 / NBRC 100828 / KAW 2/3) TaxID=1122961 RepID=A0A8G2FVD7_PICTO|nr:DUF3834 domain-containing protein [Picrophilus oshimae]SMD30197.1 Protein of unknown function [Picrophilus oshimae DSM 9789]